MMYQAPQNKQDNLTGSSQQQLQSAQPSLQDHWNTLEEFRVFLDALEPEINQHEHFMRAKHELG